MLGRAPAALLVLAACQLPSCTRGSAAEERTEAAAGAAALQHLPTGPAPRRGGPHAMGPDERDAADRRGFHYLLAHRFEIRRQVTLLANGVETLTESDNPAVAAQIREHVAAMRERMAEGRPIHARDPLFAELFAHAEEISLRLQPTDGGIRVTATSDDPRAVQLVQAHARVVDAFLENGFEEMRKDHWPPDEAD